MPSEIDFLKRSKGKIPLHIAMNISANFVERLSRLKSVKRIDSAGSLRRRKETVRDIDIVVSSNEPKKVMEEFVQRREAKEILSKGQTKSSIITKENIQVDLRVVDDESFGAALAYLTGSKAHNVKLREIAIKNSMKLNEYGIFRLKSNKKLAGRDEKGLYEALGLSFVPPEMREDRGEIDLAQKSKLPKLVELKDIKGDLHSHTEASDGTLTIEEIADIAKKSGYEYIVISDHSKTLGIAGGLSEKLLINQIKKIDKLNKKIKGIKLLKGSEVDILGDGNMDYNNDMLKELDFVIAAIHSGFKQSKAILTKRIMKAMDNRFVNMISHPTGRLMGVRDAYDIDMDEILKKAKETNTALEINSYPDRLDLNDINCMAAKANKVMLGIGTDSHTAEQMDNMKFGIYVARRGWLEKKNILNTLSLKELLKRIKK